MGASRVVKHDFHGACGAGHGTMFAARRGARRCLAQPASAGSGLPPASAGGKGLLCFHGAGFSGRALARLLDLASARPTAAERWLKPVREATLKRATAKVSRLTHRLKPGANWSLLKQADFPHAHLRSAAMEPAASLGASHPRRHRSRKAFQTLRMRHF